MNATFAERLIENRKSGQITDPAFLARYEFARDFFQTYFNEVDTHLQFGGTNLPRRRFPKTLNGTSRSRLIENPTHELHGVWNEFSTKFRNEGFVLSIYSEFEGDGRDGRDRRYGVELTIY